MQDLILVLLEKADPITLASLTGMYLLLSKKVALIKKDVEMIDKAVNNRAAEELTLSQEVTAMYRDVNKLTTSIAVYNEKIDHIEKQIDDHRKVDEETFKTLAEDIHNLACKAPRRVKRGNKACDE
jgi:uncharacterized protein YlxW (UPF0749 family)